MEAVSKMSLWNFLQEIAASYDVVDGPNDEGATVVITFVEEDFCWREIGWTYLANG